MNGRRFENDRGDGHQECAGGQRRDRLEVASVAMRSAMPGPWENQFVDNHRLPKECMMTRLLTAAVLAALVLVPTAGFAQMSANPFTDGVKAQLAQVKSPVIRTAEKVPEDLYAFKPTPDVRSLGQLIGHIADANYQICGAGGGEKPPAGGIEKSTTAKAALQKALADSFAFCEKALGSMDDKKGSEMVKTFLGMQPRLMVLAFNNSHAYEHYGNLVTYMRLKGIVPPSSEPAK